MLTHLPSLEGKSVHHYSHNDSDGYGPHILADLSNVNTTEFIHCGYDNFEPQLTKLVEFYEQYEDLKGYAILITDIAPGTKATELVDRLQGLYEKGMTLVLLDHHIKAKWIADRYPEWAFIEPEYNGRKTCATELYYLYLKENELLPKHYSDSLYLASFVEHIRSYDTWDWTLTGNSEAKELNNLLYAFGANTFMDMQIQKIMANFENVGAVQYTFNSTEQMLVQIENQREEAYINGRAENLTERVWVVDGQRYSVGVVYADQFHSVLGNELHKLNPHLDFVALIDANKAKVSLRTAHQQINVADIANAIISNGGGHPPSAGFQYDSAEQFGLFEEMMGIQVQQAVVQPAAIESPALAEPKRKASLLGLLRSRK